MPKTARILCATFVFAVAATACGDASIPADLGTQPEDPSSTTTLSPTTAPPSDSTVTTTTVEPASVAPPLPDPSFSALASPDPGVACIGTRLGLSCLIEDRWENFDRDNSPIYDWVQEVEICDDGTILATTINGVATYSAGSWTEIDTDFAVSGPKAIACGLGVIWAGFFGQVGVYADGSWTSWDTEEVLGTTEFVTGVDDIVLAPDGSAWMVTGSSVARHLGGAWTVWEEGNGFDTRFAPDAIAVDTADDGSYTVHVAAGSTGIFHYAEDAWDIQEARLNGSDSIIAVGGDIYVPAHQSGVTRYQGGAATEITVDAGLSSDDVREVAIDDQGNIWLATAYGLTVLTADGDRTYRVDNSGLLDNNAYAVVVGGPGPNLPADEPEEWASIAGVVLDETGTPYSRIGVEVCVEEQRDDFAGATPCADHPYAASGTTDETGRFEILGLRAGRYTLSVETERGWTYFIDGSVSARYDAVGGELSELGVFTVSQDPVEE